MKSHKKKKNKRANKHGLVLLFALAALFVVMIVSLPTTQTKKLTYGATIPFTPVPAHPNLQLEWFLIPTNSPPSTSVVPQLGVTPISSQPVTSSPPMSTTAPSSGPNPATCSGYINSGVPVPSSCTCPGVYLVCPYTTSDPTDVTVGPNGCEDTLLVGPPPATGKFCIDKPVIYLYPTNPTLVNVTVNSTGSVVVSNPTYPQGGWKNILANPGGTLQYEGNQYSELFYETSVTQFQKPTSGIVLASATLSTSLNAILDQLGLIGNEKQEFLSYWIPRLKALHSPYIFFSILSPSAKTQIDAVTIKPKPDTMIDFIAYFKAVETPENNTVLQLPKQPERIGFTAVEWGGVIAK
jgi:hypothetical protein